MYTIELADGTKLEHLELNGNNFISDAPLTPEMFGAVQLEHVKIVPEDEMTTDEENFAFQEMAGEYDQMKLIYAGDGGLLAPGKWRLILGTYTPAELEDMKRQGDIDYLSMMTGVEL